MVRPLPASSENPKSKGAIESITRAKWRTLSENNRRGSHTYIPPQVEEKADGTQDALIVKIHTDEGITGIGEVDSSAHVAKAIIEAPTSHSLCHGLKTLLVGENPFQIERIWEKMYQGTIYCGRCGVVLHAMAGIDIALWDLMGKALDLPVYELLGGCYRKKVRAYASSLFGDTPKDTGNCPLCT